MFLPAEFVTTPKITLHGIPQPITTFMTTPIDAQSFAAFLISLFEVFILIQFKDLFVQFCLNNYDEDKLVLLFENVIEKTSFHYHSDLFDCILHCVTLILFTAAVLTSIDTPISCGFFVLSEVIFVVYYYKNAFAFDDMIHFSKRYLSKGFMKTMVFCVDRKVQLKIIEFAKFKESLFTDYFLDCEAKEQKMFVKQCQDLKKKFNVFEPKLEILKIDSSLMVANNKKEIYEDRLDTIEESYKSHDTWEEALRYQHEEFMNTDYDMLNDMATSIESIIATSKYFDKLNYNALFQEYEDVFKSGLKYVGHPTLEAIQQKNGMSRIQQEYHLRVIWEDEEEDLPHNPLENLDINTIKSNDYEWW